MGLTWQSETWQTSFLSTEFHGVWTVPAAGPFSFQALSDEDKEAARPRKPERRAAYLDLQGRGSRWVVSRIWRSGRARFLLHIARVTFARFAKRSFAR